LSDAERQRLLGSGAFSSFFTRASRVVERVLHANTNKRGDFDPFVDYVQDDDSHVDQFRFITAILSEILFLCFLTLFIGCRVKGEELLTLRHSALCDESRVAHRPITSIDWSPKVITPSPYCFISVNCYDLWCCSMTSWFCVPTPIDRNLSIRPNPTVLC
jgi:hypothetical protein